MIDSIQNILDHVEAAGRMGAEAQREMRETDRTRRTDDDGGS